MYIKPVKYKAYGVKIKITCIFIPLYWLFLTKIGVNKMLSAAIMVFNDDKIHFINNFTFLSVNDDEVVKAIVFILLTAYIDFMAIK
jgi:hypothetical protein